MMFPCNTTINVLNVWILQTHNSIADCKCCTTVTLCVPLYNSYTTYDSSYCITVNGNISPAIR